MNPTELAWLAGLIEGEGSFSHHITRERYHNVDIKVAMTDEDVLQHCQSASDMGRVNGPYNYGNDRAWKPQWVWRVSGRVEGITLMTALFPLMGQRRRSQIANCLTVYGAHLPEPMTQDDTPEFAWLAGLVEGEGHFGRGFLRQKYHYIYLKVVMSDEDVVRRCLKVANCGKVSGPHHHSNPAFKPTWAWQVSNRADVVMMMTALRPWMGVRRQSQIDACLAIHESNPPQSPYQKRREKTHCPHGHPYAGENLYVSPRGNRICKVCSRDRKVRYQAKLRTQSPQHL